MLRQGKIYADAHGAIKWLGTLVICFTLSLLPQQSPAQEKEPVLTLEESIQMALERNLEVQVAKEEIRFAREGKNRARTGFLPRLSAGYEYRRLSETSTTVGGITSENADQDQYRFTGTVAQPLFTGFETLSNYQLAKLGLDVAKIQLQRTRLDLILAVKGSYFEILRAEKISQVAEQSVRQLQEGVRVAQNFVQVGMRPKVDVLDAETRLGEAELQLIVANNDTGVAKARFNTVLRQPIDTPVAVVDVLTTQSYERSYESSQQIALQHRPELLEANKNVAIAEKEVTLIQRWTAAILWIGKTGISLLVPPGLSSNGVRPGMPPTSNERVCAKPKRVWSRSKMVFFWRSRPLFCRCKPQNEVSEWPRKVLSLQRKTSGSARNATRNRWLPLLKYLMLRPG
jgi:hypothetical protein